MKFTDETTFTSLGIAPGNAFACPRAGKLMKLTLSPVEVCLLPLTAEQRAELEEDRLLLADLVCLEPIRQRERVTHQHRVALVLPKQVTPEPEEG